MDWLEIWYTYQPTRQLQKSIHDFRSFFRYFYFSKQNDYEQPNFDVNYFRNERKDKKLQTMFWEERA